MPHFPPDRRISLDDWGTGRRHSGWCEQLGYQDDANVPQLIPLIREAGVPVDEATSRTSSRPSSSRRDGRAGE